MKKYIELFLTFLKISAFTFGGGYAMISVIEHEVTEKRDWLTKEEFLDVVAVAESTPGPLAINSATFVGTKTAGFFGAFFATLGVVIPPFVIIGILSKVYGAYGNNPYVEYAFFGVRAAVLALLLKAVLSLAKSCKKDGYFYVMMPVAFVVAFVFDVPVLAILAFGAFCGILWGGHTMLYLDLFITFFRIGLFTFGGGYAMLPLISETALSKAWVTEEMMLNFIAVSESTPGPFALNIATFIGMEQAGPLGALCATTGVVMPSFIIILIVANFYLAFRKNKTVANVLYGIRPMVIGLLSATVLSVAQSTLFPNGFVLDRKLWISFFIAIVCFIVIKKKVHPIIPLLSSAAIGILLGCLGILGS